MNKLLGLDAACVVPGSPQPVGCFGRTRSTRRAFRAIRGGEARDRRAASYVLDRDDRPQRDVARESQYTRELGEVICASFKRDTVVMATHLAAAAAFDQLRRVVGQADLFALLRHSDDVSVPRARLAADLDILLDRARAMEARGELVLAQNLKRADGSRVLDQAIRAFARCTTRTRCWLRAARTSSSATRGCFFITRTASPHTASGSTRSRQILAQDRPDRRDKRDNRASPRARAREIGVKFPCHP